jgi:hypothetical protein
MADTSSKPRGAGGKFISEEKANNLTPENIPELVHKSSSMTGALKNLKEQKEEEELEKPLVSVSLNNPVTWLMKVINNLKKKQTTTITFRLGIPLIALPIFLAALAGLFFGLGKITTQEKTASLTQISRAGTFKLTKEGNTTTSFLILPSGEAIKLELPEGTNVEELNGKRILVSGTITQDNPTLKVTNYADMEILPESPKPIPSPNPTPPATNISVPLPSEEDAINTFVNLISEGRITTALGMLSSHLTSDEAEKQAWGVQFNAFQKIKVNKIETSDDGVFQVTFDVEMKPGTENAEPIPYFGWGNGQITRWVMLEKEGNVWKISGIATGP